MRGPARQSLLARVNGALDTRRLFAARCKAETNQLSRGVQSGLLVRPYPGFYATVERWETLPPDERILFAARAMAAKHPDWVFAGTTAALAHKLSVSWGCLNRPCVATSRKARPHDHGHIQRISVTGDKPVVRDGIPVTSFARTICDCIRSMPFCDSLALADSAARIKGIDADRLLNNVMNLCCNMPGRDRVKDVLSLADARSESGGESIARAQIIALGFALPDLQREVRDHLDPERGYRADFAWDLPDGSVIYGELDGQEKYYSKEMTDGRTPANVLLAERRREAHMTLAREPIRIVRFSLAEAMDSRGFERLLSAYGVPRNALAPNVATAC